MEVLCDQVKNYRQSLSIYSTEEAMAERIRVYTTLGLLKKEQRQLVTSVSEKLPVETFPSIEP